MTRLPFRSAMPPLATHAPAGLQPAPARPDASAATGGIAALAGAVTLRSLSEERSDESKRKGGEAL
jgi:hypothetical protein